jgi:L-asparagine permease
LPSAPGCADQGRGAITFLVVGIDFLAGRFTVEGQRTGISVIADNGGILPTGTSQLVIITSGVIFAYAAVELVGTRQAKPRIRRR